MSSMHRLLVPALAFSLLGACADAPGDDLPGTVGTVSSALTAPTERGPHGVGTADYAITMPTLASGTRAITLTVFYPTAAAPDCDSAYTIRTPAKAPAGAPPVPTTFTVRSPLCAARNAAVLAGAHPTIIVDHGGGGPGPDFQRVSQLPVHERLVTHGFIVAIAPHSGVALERILDLRRLTDFLLARSADPTDLLGGHVDADRLGASGMSAGAASTFNFVAGRAVDGVAPDPRMKALLTHELGRTGVEPTDVASLAVPHMNLAGSQFASAFFAPELFVQTTSAEPRFYVKIPGAIHMSFVAGMCELIDQAREAALAWNPTMAEPLTVNDPTSAGGLTAFFLWNIADIPAVVPLGPGFGGGRNVCARVGIDSVRSLDANGDQLTDSPPFVLDEPRLLGPAPRQEDVLPLIAHYTVAFWKVHLAGDGRYMRYLTPGYAQTHDLGAMITIAP